MYGGGATGGGKSAANAAVPPATLTATTHANHFMTITLTFRVPGVAGPVASTPGSQAKSSRTRPTTTNTSTPSVQRISLFAVRPHRLNFYVVLRKLIPKLQAFSQGIQETSMVRFYSSVYADDKMLIREMSCDRVSHGIPHPNRCRTSNEDRMLRQHSRPHEAYANSCRKFALFGATP